MLNMTFFETMQLPEVPTAYVFGLAKTLHFFYKSPEAFPFTFRSPKIRKHVLYVCPGVAYFIDKSVSLLGMHGLLFFEPASSQIQFLALLIHFLKLFVFNFEQKIL